VDRIEPSELKQAEANLLKCRSQPARDRDIDWKVLRRTGRDDSRLALGAFFRLMSVPIPDALSCPLAAGPMERPDIAERLRIDSKLFGRSDERPGKQ
jgi:hypothetical protein